MPDIPGVDNDVFEFAVPSFRKTRSGTEFSPWCAPVAVFGPAAGANFQFDAAVRESMSAQPDYDLEDYEIAPVSLVCSSDSETLLPGDAPPTPSPPVAATPFRAAPAASRHAPPKAGTSELAYRKAKGKAREKLKARRLREAAPYGHFAVKPRQVNKYVKEPGNPIQTHPDAQDMPHASTSYLGMRDSGGLKRVFGLNELVGGDSTYGFELRKWDGCTPTPILDGKERVIGICAGHPDDAAWAKLKNNATTALREARRRCRFPKGAASHRRGLFPALAIGASFGGGQEVPGNLVNTAINTAILYSLLSNIAFIRIAGFASGVFATWAPHLYSYYVGHLGPLFKTYPDLRRNFINSVFACATFNFGPTTCCFDHVDMGNLPFGWCAITALGNFNPILGGHLVLWDLRIVIEFPPGSTILIPSGSIRHSNISICPGEERYSFTQYTAGGLFRWVDHGYQTEKSYKKGWSKARKDAEEVVNQERWVQGVGMFSTLAELATMSR